MEQSETPTVFEIFDSNSPSQNSSQLPMQEETQAKIDEDEIMHEVTPEEEGEIVDSPVFEVVFQNEFEYRKYSEMIVDLFRQHLASKTANSQLDFSTKTETDSDGRFIGNIQAFETILDISSNGKEKESEKIDEKQEKAVEKDMEVKDKDEDKDMGEDRDKEDEDKVDEDKGEDKEKEDEEKVEEDEEEVCEEEEEEEEGVILCDDAANSDKCSNDSQDFSIELNNLFTIDPTPSSTLESAAVPSYRRAIKELLDGKVKKPPPTPENFCPRPRPSASCFNCGATNHGIRDCTLPKSAKRINRAKKARMGKGERYHADVDQRFAHLRPGVISDRLHRALRLRHGELPSFFYRMRVCGYPPGWLEDAKVSDSGLAMFNTGDDVLKSEAGGDTKDDIKYDISKIIEFPGFNVSPGCGFYDDYRHYNVPPMSRKNLRDDMITALGDSVIKGYKRKKLKEETTPPITTESNVREAKGKIESHDMEIEDDEAVQTQNVEFNRPMPPPLPYSEENPPPPPEGDVPSPPPFVPSSPPCTSSTAMERSESPTLAELQERQRALLRKLECGEELQNDEDEDDDDEEEEEEDISLAISTDIPTETDIVATPTTPITMATPATPTTPAIPATPTTPAPSEPDLKKIIKSSYMGTPVLHFSPFEKLPAGENFKVGVSDVINFENLPDSTGKYESMKDIIKKVRSIKKQLNAEDD